MSDNEVVSEQTVVQRKKKGVSEVKKESKKRESSKLYTSLRGELPGAPESLLEFLESRKEEDRKGLVQKLKLMSLKDLLEYENRRRWILAKYPHAFSDAGQTAEEAHDVRSQLSVYEPIFSSSFKAHVTVLVLAFLIISFVLYQSANVNTFNYVMGFVENTLKPKFPK